MSLYLWRILIYYKIQNGITLKPVVTYFQYKRKEHRPTPGTQTLLERGSEPILPKKNVYFQPTQFLYFHYSIRAYFMPQPKTSEELAFFKKCLRGTDNEDTRRPLPSLATAPMAL
jgi:hypothetical protein